MNIDFTRLMSNRGVASADQAKAAEVPKALENQPKPLFSDSLVVKEKESLMVDDFAGVDMDEVEKELVRDDRLGKLVSSALDWPMPEMPQFV